LSERIGLTESEIAKSLRLDTMYHLAQTMPLDGDTHGVVANPHKFSLSTLERLIDTRSLNKRADIDHYLEKKLGKDKPDKKKKGTFTSESLLTGGSAQPAPA